MMRSKRYPAYAWQKGQHDTVRARLAELEKGLANGLGGHLKTGHTWSLQNRPTKLTQNKSNYT